MDDDHAQLIRLEEQLKQLAILIERNRADTLTSTQELKKGIAEIHIRVDTISEGVVENRVARNIGKAVLWLFTTTGVAYIIQHFRM